MDFRNLVLVVAAFLAVATPAGFGQATAASDHEGQKGTFEVVSIRQNKTGVSAKPGVLQLGSTPDGWHMINSPLTAAILVAYVPQSGGSAFYGGDNLIGFPEWTKNERYDIDAKVFEADQAEWQKPTSQPAMLQARIQAMLAERCKLVVHRDTKEVPVYSLVIGKNGPKFKQASPDDPHPSGQALPGGGVVVVENGGTLHFYGAPVNTLASVLSSAAGRPVQDKTGLTGRYDFQLQRPTTSGPSTQQEASSASDPGHSIFSVVEDLGLKLQPVKGSVETLVLDHIERPSEN